MTRLKRILLSFSIIAALAYTAHAGKSPWIFDGQDAKLIIPGTAKKADGTEFATGMGASVFADDVFRIEDNADTTKKIALEAANITTATTRTITMKDADIDLNDVITNTTNPTQGGELAIFPTAGVKNVVNKTGLIVVAGFRIVNGSPTSHSGIKWGDAAQGAVEPFVNSSIDFAAALRVVGPLNTAQNFPFFVVKPGNASDTDDYVQYHTSADVVLYTVDTNMDQSYDTVVDTTTINATITTVITLATTTDTSYNVEINCLGRQTNGINETGGYKRMSTFRNNGGTLIEGVESLIHTSEVIGSWNCTLDVSGTNIIATVAGDTGDTVDWKVHMIVHEN